MRGWASIMVIYYHAALFFMAPAIVTLPIFLSGYSGIYFFFLISGYILMRKFESGDYDVKNKFNLLKYYLRRIFRIWPLYFVSLPLFAQAQGGFIPWQDFLFIQNLFPSTFAFAPFWTLVIEELFYLILPIWAIAFHRNWKLSLGGMAALTLGYMLFISIFLNTPNPSTYEFAQFPAYALTYALGTIIALGKRIRVNWVLVTAAWVLLSIWFSFPAAETLWLPVILFSGVYYLILCNMSNSRFFTNKISYFLGGLTYPMYLIGATIELWFANIFGHTNLIWLPLSFIAIIATAYLLHRSFERPLIGVGYVIESLIFGTEHPSIASKRKPKRKK